MNENTKPAYLSDEAWDRARWILSSNFITPIGSAYDRVVSLASDIQTLENFDFKLSTWEEFLSAKDRPDNLLERAQQYRKDGAFDFVAYDPLDDENGFMLVGNDAEEIANNVCEYISEAQE